MKNDSNRYRYSYRASKQQSEFDMSFEASEAYKRLRTNLSFLFSQSDKCRVLGVTSSIRGEGKSTTASHLAFSFAEEGRKVLLIELDMRLPTIFRHFSLPCSPGFSNIMTGLSIDQVIQPSGKHPNLSIITAGDPPSNPAEILSSDYMYTILEYLEQYYEYIIVDLPPVNIVSDALSVSRLLDGMILVVRENYSRKRELNEALRQLSMVNARILGFVVNDDISQDHGYGYKYRKHYGYHYSSRNSYYRQPAQSETEEPSSH